MRELLGPAGMIVTTIVLLLFGSAGKASADPAIVTVTPILPQANQTITITGAGFGTLPPYIGDSDFIRIRDLTARWSAGYSGDNPPDRVTLVVAAWTDSQIVLGGFRGAYGYRRWRLRAGDRLMIEVWNPQTRIGPATHATTISQAASIGPASWLRLAWLTGATAAHKTGVPDRRLRLHSGERYWITSAFAK